ESGQEWSAPTALHRTPFRRVRLPPRSLTVDEGDPRALHGVRKSLRGVGARQSLSSRCAQRVEEERDVDGVRGTQRTVERAGRPRELVHVRGWTASLMLRLGQPDGGYAEH